MNVEDFNSGYKIGVEDGKKQQLEKIYEALGLYELIDSQIKHLEDNDD